MNFLLILSLIAVIGGYAAAKHFVSLCLDPLQKFSVSISKVKAGELNQQLDIKTNDETGKLAREFNEMTTRLQNYEVSTLGCIGNVFKGNV